MFLVKAGHHNLFRFGSLGRIPGLTHAVTSRLGGASRAPFDGLNTSLGVGDNPAAVNANRGWLRQMTGGTHVYTRQNHGTAIQVIRRRSLPPGEDVVTAPEEADALITDAPGVRLLIQTADCQAVMLADPCRRVAANIHCGWRGSVADIIGKTVARMVTEFGCRAADMVAATIKDSIKGKDVVSRIGGEEFAVLLPETPYAGALKLAENMRLTFERLDLKKKNTGESLGLITLSFGVAVYRQKETAEDFVQRADEALYQSKKAGRNTVTGL